MVGFVTDTWLQSAPVAGPGCWFEQVEATNSDLLLMLKLEGTIASMTVRSAEEGASETLAIRAVNFADKPHFGMTLHPAVYSQCERGEIATILSYEGPQPHPVEKAKDITNVTCHLELSPDNHSLDSCSSCKAVFTLPSGQLQIPCKNKDRISQLCLELASKLQLSPHRIGLHDLLTSQPLVDLPLVTETVENAADAGDTLPEMPLQVHGDVGLALIS